MSQVKNVYMIGNAHLDPVWLWHWQEGSAEAKATIRSALDRMKEFLDFKFVCSSVSVYEWIEEFAPEMFEEVKARVKEGRFVPVNGWYVQPDCNLPSGEGFARQSLYSQQYYKEKFGVTATVGYDVDSFGHNEMLPQILKKSGMDSYIFMRPGEHEKHLPVNLFRWRSPDGSEVVAYRITDGYGFSFRDVEELKERVQKVAAECDENAEDAMLFYGVGNHGGGPTIRNIEKIHEYQQSGEAPALVFGDPADFFQKAARREDLPVFAEEMQHHASGCYAVVSGIKNAVRRSEHELCDAEVYSILANRLAGREVPTAELRRGWKDVLFLHFHDILSGTSIKSAYEDCKMFAGEARMIASRTANNALQTISWMADTRDTSKGVPVLFFNPHSWDYDGPVTINELAFSVVDGEGNPVVSQHVFGEVVSAFGRSDTLFHVHIPAMGYATYFFSHEAPAQAEEFPSGVAAGRWFLENDRLRAEFDTHTGWIARLYDKAAEKELLSGPGAEPVVIDEHHSDTWSHGIFTFDREIGRFTDAVLTVLEEGPLRAAIRVESRYGASTLTQIFTLEAGEDKLRVQTKLNWQEKHKMLKLRFAVNAENPASYCQIPFGVTKRPCLGTEEFGHEWAALKGENGGLAILNDKKYSFSFQDNLLNLTAIRSPLYADHGARPRNDRSPFTDQGEHEFQYVLLAAGESFSALTRAAAELNAPPTALVETWHAGTLPLQYQGICCGCGSVSVSALKRSEDGKALILRAYETDGKNARAAFSGEMIGTALTADFTPYEVKTFRLDDGSDAWREVLLTEFDR